MMQTLSIDELLVNEVYASRHYTSQKQKVFNILHKSKSIIIRQ